MIYFRKRYLLIFLFLFVLFLLPSFCSATQNDISFEYNGNTYTITNSSLLTYDNITILIFRQNQDYSYGAMGFCVLYSDDISTEFCLYPSNIFSNSVSTYSAIGYDDNNVKGYSRGFSSYLYHGLSYTIQDVVSDLNSYDFSNRPANVINTSGTIQKIDGQSFYYDLVFSNNDVYSYSFNGSFSSQYGFTKGSQIADKTETTPVVIDPYFVSGQVSNFENGVFDDVLIIRNDSFVENVSPNLYLHICRYYENTSLYDSNSDLHFYFYDTFQTINCNDYVTQDDVDGTLYDNPYISIPYSALNYNFVNGNNYMFWLDTVNQTNLSYNHTLPDKGYEDTSGTVFLDVIKFTVGGVSEQDTLNNIYNFFNDTNIGNDTNNDINSSLNYNNNTAVDNIATGFFSRLMTKFQSFTNYNLNEDTTISILLPHSDTPIILHSNLIYSNLHIIMKNIITLFWSFIFGFYLLKFILKIFRSIKTGKILENFETSDEVITTNLL